jgi:hypothetical protein
MTGTCMNTYYVHVIEKSKSIDRFVILLLFLTCVFYVAHDIVIKHY